MIVRACSFLAVLALGVSVLLVFPIARNLLTLPTHYEFRRSHHPASPFKPPRYSLTEEQIASFRRDGLLVIRGILTPLLAKKMEQAGTDLMDQPVMHCEMSRFVGPPIFHAYDHYCRGASLVHDYFRDIMYTSTLTHAAAQLLEAGDKQPVRQIADVFVAGGKLPRRWHSDFQVFARQTRRKEIACQDGLVFWMPLESSYKEKNGMLFLNGSSQVFADHFREDHLQAHVLDTYRQWLFNLPKENYVAPELELGDVVAFDQCNVHSTSGLHEGGTRRAYQLRFQKNFDMAVLGEAGLGVAPGTPNGPGPGNVSMPQLWPQTLEEEDNVRSLGHVVHTRTEWIKHLMYRPKFTLASAALALKTNIFGDKGGRLIRDSCLKYLLR